MKRWSITFLFLSVFIVAVGLSGRADACGKKGPMMALMGAEASVEVRDDGAVLSLRSQDAAKVTAIRDFAARLLQKEGKKAGDPAQDAGCGCGRHEAGKCDCMNGGKCGCGKDCKCAAEAGKCDCMNGEKCDCGKEGKCGCGKEGKCGAEAGKPACGGHAEGKEHGCPGKGLGHLALDPDVRVDVLDLPDGAIMTFTSADAKKVPVIQEGVRAFAGFIGSAPGAAPSCHQQKDAEGGGCGFHQEMGK